MRQFGLRGMSDGKLGGLDCRGMSAAQVIGFFKNYAEFPLDKRIFRLQRRDLPQRLGGSPWKAAASLNKGQRAPEIGLIWPLLRRLSGSFGGFVKLLPPFQNPHQGGKRRRRGIAQTDPLTSGLSGAVKRSIVPKYEFGQSRIARRCRRAARQVDVGVFDSRSNIAGVAFLNNDRTSYKGNRIKLFCNIFVRGAKPLARRRRILRTPTIKLLTGTRIVYLFDPGLRGNLPTL
jgi:hypothetical protein